MAQIRMQLTGLDELKRSFSRAPFAIAQELNQGIKRSAIIVERTAKIKSPVDTGRLRASHRTKLSPLRGEIEPTVKYAIFVHEPGVTRRWAGKPWMDETADEVSGDVENEMQEAVDRALKKI